MRRLFLLLFFVLALASCREECVDCKFAPVLPTEASRVLLLYLGMDNNLGSYADQNIEEVYSAAGKDAIRDGVVYVFRDVPGQNSQLIAIFYDYDRGMTRKVVVKTYASNLDSSDPETFRVVWDDVHNLISAPSWGLCFGGHGLGWLPKALSGQYTTRRAYGGVLTRTLLQDVSSGGIMEFQAFADMMPEEGVDFVIMDMCYMGGVEFAWAMKDKADWLVLSPAEIIAKGMPYHKIVDDIFAPEADLRGVCEEFYNFYDAYTDGLQYGTIALVDCSKMDAFAGVMREVVHGRDGQIAALDLNGLQRFDRFGRHSIFDLGEFVAALGGHPQFAQVRDALLPYYNTTGKALEGGLSIPKTRFGGLGTYVPVAAYANLNEYYYQTGWAQAIY